MTAIRHAVTLAVGLPRGLAIVTLCAAPVLAQSFTHGDAVGSLTHDSALIWSRSSAAGLVSVRYAASPILTGALETPQVATASSTDFVAKVQLAGLQPATRYWYAARVATHAFPNAGVLGAIGTFRTAAAPGTHDRVSFALSGDIWRENEFDIFPLMQAHGADFYLHLGDYPYADGARTLSEYWDMHKSRRNRPAFTSLLHALPWVAIWDDHEVVNDWDANTDPLLVTNGRRAFVTYTPIAESLQDIYRTRRWGDTVELFLLDCRTYRGVNADPDLPAKPMLGSQQRTWLEQQLTASTALFKVIAVSVPLHYTGSSRDKWSAYRHARQRLLDIVVDNEIDNVVFVSSDLHWAASNQLRHGVREFQFGPLAQFIGTPPPFPDAQARWRMAERNYGLITVDPFAMPPTLTVEWYGLNGLLRREVVPTSQPARLQVSCDVSEGAFQLDDGPFHLRDTGSRVGLPRVEPGAYRMRFRDLVDGDGPPASIDLPIPSGGDVRVAADYRDFPQHPNPILLENDFSQPLQGFQVVDQGTTSGPSSWFTDAGKLIQSSNIYGTSNGIDEPGTMAWTGDTSWVDYTLSTRLRSRDNDALGVVFRFRDPANHYRFSMDSERTYRRLVSVRNGAFRVLAQDAVAYARHRSYDVRIAAIGNRIRVLLDGIELFDVADIDHPSGAVGLYCRANHIAEFDHLIVRAGDATTGTRRVLHRDTFDDGVLTGFSIVDQGTTGGSANWFEAGGLLRQTGNTHDPGTTAGLRLGTMAITGPVAQDVDLRVALNNGDDDGIGIVLRYSDTANYYRFHMDAQQGWRRLDKVVGGQWSLLWEGPGSYDVGTWHRLSVSARGDVLRATLNGETLCEVRDTSLTAGQCGLYCYASDAASFEDLLIQDPGAPRAVTAAILQGAATEVMVQAPASAGERYVLLVSGGRSPGLPMSQLQPGDPRILELAPDPFLAASLTPNPFLINFAGVLDSDGRAAGRILFPPIAGLSGALFYAGGVILAPGGGFGELLPTVEILFP